MLPNCVSAVCSFEDLKSAWSASQKSQLASVSAGPLGRGAATSGALCHTRKQSAGVTMQRAIDDHPIPFVILFGLILLTVWFWRWFKDR
jgi:hypothetical protein